MKIHKLEGYRLQNHIGEAAFEEPLQDGSTGVSIGTCIGSGDCVLFFQPYSEGKGYVLPLKEIIAAAIEFHEEQTE